MSIRAIAQELYKSQAKVHELEDLLHNASPAANDTLQKELREARAELKILKNMLEGRKSQKPEAKKSYYLTPVNGK